MTYTMVVTFEMSEFGEHVLGVAVPEAAATGAEVHLLHVMQPARDTAAGGSNFDPVGSAQNAALVGRTADPRVREIETSTQAAERGRYEALNCLHGVAARFPAGTTRAEVREGSHPAREIIAYAEEIGAGKIVMATHGRSAVAHVVLGSVAAAVVRASPIPVLLSRPKAMPRHPEDARS
jgi:nucleotide-binding universal stress UspA family protein